MYSNRESSAGGLFNPSPVPSEQLQGAWESKLWERMCVQEGHGDTTAEGMCVGLLDEGLNKISLHM